MLFASHSHGPLITYDSWRALHFPDPADFANPALSGPDANPAGDGVPNLMRHALSRSFYVHGGSDRFPMTAHTEAIGLSDLAAELAAIG